MTLAEAKALCPRLTHAEHRPDDDRKALAALARWMVRFSPVVAVEPPDALLLDVTGSERVFKGFDRLARLASDALAKLGLGHGLCIAPTPGAAWALASFAPGGPGVVTPGRLPGALLPLPAAALRLGDDVVEAFALLGIETVGQLTRLPRSTLPARFGAAVLTRLDQAFGRSAEPLVPVGRREPIDAQLLFDGVVESQEAIREALGRVLNEVGGELRRRGCGRGGC